MNYSKGEVVLLPIPFSNLESAKVRPAVVIGQFSTTEDLIVVPITSKLVNTDFVLKAWKEAGLNIPSGIKGHIATIENRLVRKRVGNLTAPDLAALEQHLAAWLNLR